MTHPENYNGTIYQCDDTYSDKDCTGWDLSGRTDMSGIIIHGLCLSNETPNAAVLPPDLTGTTFLLCNLDNVFIPSGNTLIGGSNRLFQVQADGQDWLLQTTAPLQLHGTSQAAPVGSLAAAQAMVLTPLQPLNLATTIADGLNTDPSQIQGTS